MAPSSELNTPPTDGWHNAMVNNMKIGDLIKFFSHNKENGIQKLGEFAEVIPPTHLGNDQLIRVIGIVDWLAAKAITEEPRMNQTLNYKKMT